MPLEPGKTVVPSALTPQVWPSLIEAARRPFVLAPATASGWFEGRAIVGLDPWVTDEACDPAAALRAVDAAFASDEPVLAVALLAYDGPSAHAVYRRGLELDRCGWRAWGEWSDVSPSDIAGAGPTPPGTMGPGPAGADASIAAAISERIAGADGPRPSVAPGVPLAFGIRADMDAADFIAAIEAVHEAVRDGAVYVLNLTRRLIGAPALPPDVAFEALCSRASASMAAYLDTGRRVVASVSPERFVAVRREADGSATAEVHPIKGTRPRGHTSAEDEALARELAASAKERSEHVMIIDLERNDLGRVCIPGSIDVEPLMEVVATPYCHQMVSRVRGTLAPGIGMGALIEATFPCGSVTGAPKIAAMEHISRLESSPRGAYTGSLVVAMPGSLDSSVLIRTAEYEGDTVRWGTGGGITIDSDPEAEWRETLVKAAPFLGLGAPPSALLETCRVVDGAVPLWSWHRRRLASGGCDPALLSLVDTRLREALAASRRGPDATDESDRPGAARDHDVPGATGEDRVPVGTGSGEGPEGPTRLRVTVGTDGAIVVQADRRPSALDIDGGPMATLVEVEPGTVPRLPASAAKPADRAFWDDAQAIAGADAQAVLVTADGRVFDGATATVWVVLEGVAVTPPAPPAVAGVVRTILIERGPAADVPVAVRPLRSDELALAEEVFFTNALAGVVAARGRSGPVTARARELLETVFAAEAGRRGSARR